MKTNRAFRLWQLVAVLTAALLAFSCEKPDTPQPPQDEQETPGNNEGNGNQNEGNGGQNEPTYAITGPTSEFYQVEFPESAKKGENVTVTVTPVEDVNIVGVRYNMKKADLVEGNVYTFEMPDKDVKLTVESSSTVTVIPSNYFTSTVLIGDEEKTVAQAGDEVIVGFGVYHIDDCIVAATVNGTIECDLVTADALDGVYIYSFTMPEGPAVVQAFMADEYHVIYREWDDHCVISMLDCINNQGTPDEFCSQKEGGIVHFIYKCDLGYEVTCSVTGLTTGKDYTGDLFWSLASESHLYQDSWAFNMPDEPVVITAVSTENSAYEGAAFVGTYKGYWVTLGDNKIYSSSQPTMDLELLSSSAYFVRSTDENAYDFAGIYSENNGQITADREAEKIGDYALRGQILENGYAFAIIDDLLVDNVDNRRFYLTGKNGFSFVCAADYSDNRYLLEANQGGQKTWYFVERDNQSIKKADLTFVSGSSIGETCEAMVTVEGGIEFNRTETFQYTYHYADAPVFTYIGKEAGTYSSDKGETLVLDGFGHGIYNGTEGTYTIEATLVTFTAADGTETKFNLNINEKTFTVIVENTGLELDPRYSTTTAWIHVDGKDYETGKIIIVFDANYNATTVKEGYAFIQITYMDAGKEKEMIGASQPYFIDAEARTVTISDVLQGNGGWGTTKKDIVLDISEDCKTLTFADAYIYSTSSPYILCYGQEWAPIYSESK